jgi:hypothetical protein
MIGNGEELNAFAFRFGYIVMQRAVSVGAGDGVHMQVNGVHGSLL